MRRRFIVAAEGLDKAQQSEFSKHMTSLGLAWWHWVDNVWLLTTLNEDFDYQKIHENIRSLSNNQRWLVMEIPEDITWRAGPAKLPSSGRKLSDWLRSPWGDKD